MSFANQTTQLIEAAGKLLNEGTVSTIIGFREGGIEGMSIPCILSDPQQVDQLVWNNRCVPNIASYLLGREGKTAIVAKPCDTRAVVNLILENQIQRDNIYLIGMSCPGMVNEEGNMLPACKECRVNTPPLYDLWIENPEVTPKEKTAGPAEANLDESLARFQAEMDKCILCYACRQACYGCYCQTCFMDRGMPDWQAAKPDRGMKMLYHLGRAMHLSGRCVECGACENACASGVDVRYLIREVTHFIDDLYGYQTGLDLETESVMLTYKEDDREIGFLGGDTHV